MNMPSHTPMNRATENVYRYLCESFGKKILMAQQETPNRFDQEEEITWIMEHTGKLPALRCMDYINRDFEGVNRRAVRWWRMGGLVSICWHVGIFDGGYPQSKEDEPDFDKLLTSGTEENIRMLHNWDVAAFYLRKLKEAGVPVIWRPFHEFDGQWFWWGKGGGEYFIRLWRMMYDRFTNYFKLDNLIWLLGYADDVKEGWYPGDDYVDLIGSDTYRPGPSENVGTTHKTAWQLLEKMEAKKMPFVFHECGKVPDIDSLWQEECPWLWFMPWHSKWIRENDPELIRQAYLHERSVTLDRLPGFD
ncbi:MAG: mannan endo-1,4-beta-mannosidase A and B [Clostridia bacterium]|nr:mannan endo-1,4-beta-mannosidase A and B [Clostridia bacterium]